jgi:hypothetical protein
VKSEAPAREGERETSAVGANARQAATASAEPPTDAELEWGILDAVRLGLGDVARTLSGQLEERRRARAPNVILLRREAT